MKLSEETIEILKNFTTINPGILIKPGKTLRTIKSNKAVFAEAEISEEFDREFGLHDLSKVLGLLSLNKNAEVTVQENCLVYNGLNGTASIRQRFTDPKLIISPPNKKINLEYQVSFELSQEVQKWIFDAASILGCPNIVVYSSGERDDELKISAMDVKNTGEGTEQGAIVDDATVGLGVPCLVKFQASFKIENLQILPGAYIVDVSSGGAARFKNKTKPVTYFIAVEQQSSSFE